MEKPTDLRNNLVVVGFYYFKESSQLLAAIEEQMRRGKSLKGEFFLTDAINIFIENGGRMRLEQTTTWLDAGIPEALLETNRYYLDHGKPGGEQAVLPQGVAILPPVYIHPSAQIESAVIGPYVSIGKGARLRNVILRDSIVDERALLENIIAEGSLIGRDTTISGKVARLNLGDNTSVKG